MYAASLALLFATGHGTVAAKMPSPESPPLGESPLSTAMAKDEQTRIRHKDALSAKKEGQGLLRALPPKVLFPLRLKGIEMLVYGSI